MRPLAKLPNLYIWYSCQPIGIGILGKVIAKLCHTAGFEGHYSNHSLHSTAATRLYDHNVNEQQISEVTGHKSVAIRNYKRTSMQKQCEFSDVLYGKKKKSIPTSTVTSSAEANFELGMNSQANATEQKPMSTDVTITPTVNVNVNVNVNKVDVKKPVVTINQPRITVSPVINLCTQDLPCNELGHLQLPEIDIALTININ